MNSRGRRRIDEIGDESRRRILDAAEALFAERGFDRTSFVDISERSGISRGSIPWHFKNKHGLVMAVVERAIERAMQVDQYTTLPTFAELLEDYAKWLREGNSALLFMILTEAMSSTGAVHRQYQEFLAERRRGVGLWLRAQRPEGVDPAIASKRERAFAAAIVGMLYGIHLQALIDPDGIDIDETLRLVAAQFDKYLPDLWGVESPVERASCDNRSDGESAG
ncbi:TetR/AcrR family transcriptional regulator [Thermopolyspora sp. NPDC052614]|uniref:TetR/AcrR family transcriptional regulator n=1 Tax=Thermopolyspora sp. NPDC052614 TaxID=3155682 RepID=UPI003423537B